VSADEETPELDDEVVPCTVCRGTGTLISNLGGTPSTVDCAWCEGTGTFLPDHDAQAAKKAEREAAPAPAEPSEDDTASSSDPES
jgi:DnaJ-class molecular chaperone